MDESNPSFPPERGDPTRHGSLSSRIAATPEPAVEAELAFLQQVLEDRLEQGLRAIHQSANALMHEIASEVWRVAGGDKDQVGSQILESLSRDQAIRSLVAHSDERFQDLAVRTARLEDSVTSLAEDTRAARAALADSVHALEQAVGAPAVAGYEELRGQLERVTTQVASAFKALADRDRIIVQTVQEQVKAHGELITRETSHVARSMEMYVKEGVNALGLLAGHIDQQVEEMTSRDQDVTANVGSAFQGLLGEQVDLLAERLGIEARDIGSSVGAATRAIEEINGTLDARMMGLGRLVRSDSQALQQELNRTAAATEERVARTLDEQTGRVTEALTSATRWTVEEMTRRLREETGRAVQGQLEEAVARLGRANEDAIDAAIAGRFETALDRLTAAAQNVQRVGRDDDGQLAREVDDRITALGRMIRSDNLALAAKMQAATEQPAAKQALRAVKELQANLPNEIQRIVEDRVQAISEQLHRDVQASAESVAKLGEGLERKFEQATTRIGQRHDKELQVVMDRMGDAMHALASLSRQEPERVELD
ncbi:MAG TPA: hypothetical protein VFM85_08540 [Actinomycetota bacterium]|nr:hypothetical protein [Actinomycetota bacterium]